MGRGSLPPAPNSQSDVKQVRVVVTTAATVGDAKAPPSPTLPHKREREKVLHPAMRKVAALAIFQASRKRGSLQSPSSSSPGRNVG
jgi:hypothetical protein